MRDDKALALFNEIAAKTAAKMLDWKPAAVPGHFVASLAGKYTLKLWPYTFVDDVGEEHGGPSITLNDEKSNTIVDITDSIDGIGKEKLSDLAKTIARFGLKIDDKIEDALQALKKLGQQSA
jgi:hypothetical protein